MPVIGPLVLSIAYLALAFIWQAILLRALPNTGMGQIGLTFVLWPVLVATAVGLYFGLRRFWQQRVWIFGVAFFAMAIFSIAMFPQDDNSSAWQKLESVYLYST